MSALAVAVEAAGKSPGIICSIRRTFDAMEKLDDAETLVELLATPAVTGAAIARGLTAIGFDVKAQAVTRHRAGECACP